MNSGEEKLLRLLKLQTSANSLALEGKRPLDSLDLLIEAFQQFVFGKDLGVELWLETYKALGLEAEYREGTKKLFLPEDQKLWYLPMVPGVTSNKIVAGHRRSGAAYWLFNEDLDTVVPNHDRDANCNGPYVVGFRRNVEADDEFAEKSAVVLAGINHKGICLPERLLLGAGYHIATGQHLDLKVITLCTGSRSGDGDVPNVGWDSASRRVCVGWCRPDDANDVLRSRSVQFLSLAEQP